MLEPISLLLAFKHNYIGTNHSNMKFELTKENISKFAREVFLSEKQILYILLRNETTFWGLDMYCMLVLTQK